MMNFHGIITINIGSLVTKNAFSGQPPLMSHVPSASKEMSLSVGEVFAYIHAILSGGFSIYKC